MRRRFWWEAPLADIKNHNELEAWLQRRQQREVSVAFAARAALRVLPTVWQARGRGFKGDFLAGIVLPVFRATGVAWVTARYPDQEMPLLLANAAGAASIAAVSAPSAASVVIAATSAATTAASATLTNAAAAAVRGADAAARAAHAAYGTGPSFGLNLHRAATPLWTAVSIDATRVDEGATASVIADSPLWPERPPDRLPFLWQELKAALLAAKQDWDVWTDWYDDRLDGRARNEERDLAYVRIEEALWAQGPAIVNAEIKKLIEETPQPGVVKLQAHSSSGARVSAGVSLSVAEPAISAVPVYNPPITGAATQHLSEISSAWQSADAASAAPHPRRQYAPDVVVNPVALGAGGTPPAPIEAIPEQEPLATRFGVNTKGLIDLVPDPPAHGTAADPLQREFYEETRLKAQALVELGPNLLGALSDPANRFREGLKDRIEDISITSLWSRGNTLRIRLKAHDLSVSNGEPDPGRLHTLAAETLRDVVHTWNIFIVGDPKGRELDEMRLGPQEAEAARQVIAAAIPIVEAIEHSENVATPLAVEAVAEQAEAAKNALPGIHGDQAIDLSRKTTGNFVSELLRSAYSLCRDEGAVAWKEFRAGIYRAAGTATFNAVAASASLTGIIWFVVRYADALKGFVTASWHNPTLVEIIDFIVRVWP